MPGAHPPTRLRWLYVRAEICRLFPSYKLSDFDGPDGEPIVPILQAMQLLDAAHKVRYPLKK